MLLQHAWLAPMVKPMTITEEDEDAEAAAEAAAAAGEDIPEPSSEASSLPVEAQGDFVDREVGEWVIDALRKKKAGTLGQHTKPALHAAPLDAAASR
jgi:mitogen-activated protein kinase kinase